MAFAQLWRDFLDEVAARGPLVKRSGDWLCLGWPVEAPQQTVQVSLLEAHGRVCVLLTADVCHADKVAARQALELAPKVLVGGPVIQQGILALRCVLVEGRFTRQLFWETVEELRHNAISYRAHLLPNNEAAALDLFKHLVD